MTPNLTISRLSCTHVFEICTHRHDYLILYLTVIVVSFNVCHVSHDLFFEIYQARQTDRQAARQTVIETNSQNVAPQP